MSENAFDCVVEALHFVESLQNLITEKDAPRNSFEARAGEQLKSIAPAAPHAAAAIVIRRDTSDPARRLAGPHRFNLVWESLHEPAFNVSRHIAQ